MLKHIIDTINVLDNFIKSFMLIIETISLPIRIRLVHQVYDTTVVLDDHFGFEVAEFDVVDSLLEPLDFKITLLIRTKGHRAAEESWSG